MKARRLLIAAMWLNILTASATATAETMVVRPDPCAADATMPLIIDIGEGDTVTLYPASRQASEVFVLYPAEDRGWASARILARFRLEDESGEQYSRRHCRQARRSPAMDKPSGRF